MTTTTPTPPIPSPASVSTANTSTGAKGGAAKKKKTRKKKATTKKSNAAQTAALNSAARQQYQKLLKQREDKFHDPAWLSSINSTNAQAVPVTGSGTGTGTGSQSSLTASMPAALVSAESPSFLEQDVEIVNRALINNGLTMEDVTAEGFACLLEEARKYAMELITDAGDYGMHSHGNDNITASDLMLAKEMQNDRDFNLGDNMDMLSEIAQKTNRMMLPPIPDTCYNGIVLPDIEHTLLGRAFDIVCREDEKTDDAVEEMASEKVEGEKRIPSYGARRGSKQLQISLKSK